MRDELLEVALEAAHRAGKELAERWGGRKTVRLKGYRDVLTEADLAAEAAILALVEDRFPEHAILAEESGSEQGAAPFVWVIDPLDGTTNFSRGHPTFSVSIAVLEEDVPVVGVVHDPLRGHTFGAQQGGGATLNGRPIHAGRSDTLPDALVAVDWAHDDDDRRRLLDRLNVLAPHCRTVRALGSAALALAYVGAGWLEIYFAAALEVWDVAAGGLIVCEAGGRITGWQGEEWELERPAVLATNGRLHEAVLRAWESDAPPG